MRSLYEIVEENKSVREGFDLFTSAIKHIIKKDLETDYAKADVLEYMLWYKQNKKETDIRYGVSNGEYTNSTPTLFMEAMFRVGFENTIKPILKQELLESAAIEFIILVNQMIEEDFKIELVFGKNAFNPQRETYQEWIKTLDNEVKTTDTVEIRGIDLEI